VSITGRALSDQIEITGSATVGSQQEAEMTFPNPPVATMCIYRITQRDCNRRGLRGTRRKLLLLVVALSPLVMAIW
jgi:hypothetical protein